MVRPEAMYDRPIAERHRIVFYVGHVEAFDWNLLNSLCGLASFRPDFDRLFALGIDPIGIGLPVDQPKDWPELHEVHSYRDRVRQALDRTLATEAASKDESYEYLLNVAIEHRWMHAETLSYMFHQMPFERKDGLVVRRALGVDPIRPEYALVPAGAAVLGLHRDGRVFGWDNEFEAHTVNVPEFTIDKYKITNSQFLEFLNAGGYSERVFWTDADWDWKNQQGISHPVFWIRHGDAWSYRSMFDAIPLQPHWPVYVSHAEASAYSRWAGKRLPTEAEWHRAAEGIDRDHPGDPSADSWDPAPVNSLSGSSAFGIEGLIANGWEWTSTPFAPFSGFRRMDCYPGYSANFFDGQHFVLKGGSVRTASSMLRLSFRNWFQPHYQYVYAGFRCVGL
jgi:ergothioneine biosynthesis protein EgtB